MLSSYMIKVLLARRMLIFVDEIVRISAYSCMLTVLSLSTVIQRPIHTIRPVVSPLSKLVVGRDVPNIKELVILWTISTSYSGIPVHINHFVPLIKFPAVTVDGKLNAVPEHATSMSSDTTCECDDVMTDEGDVDDENCDAEGGKYIEGFMSGRCLVEILLSCPDDAVKDVTRGLSVLR